MQTNQTLRPDQASSCQISTKRRSSLLWVFLEITLMVRTPCLSTMSTQTLTRTSQSLNPRPLNLAKSRERLKERLEKRRKLQLNLSEIWFPLKIRTQVRLRRLAQLPLPSSESRNLSICLRTKIKKSRRVLTLKKTEKCLKINQLQASQLCKMMP